MWDSLFLHDMGEKLTLVDFFSIECRKINCTFDLKPRSCKRVFCKFSKVSATNNSSLDPIEFLKQIFIIICLAVKKIPYFFYNIPCNTLHTGNQSIHWEG